MISKTNKMTAYNFMLDILLPIGSVAGRFDDLGLIGAYCNMFYSSSLLNASPLIWLLGIAPDILFVTNRYSANVDHDTSTSYL